MDIQNHPMKDNTPHHLGHRDRLRQRFSEGDTNALADYELLELVLFTAIPRKDVKPIAKDLIATFGTLHKMMAAPIIDLCAVKGISENTAIFLQSVFALQNRSLRREILKKPVLSNWDRLIDYCHSAMAEDDIERFRILYLNKKNELLSDEIHASGTIDAANVYTREVMKKAMNLGATAMILVHNHPSGDPTPSKPDIDITYALQDAAQPLGILIHDHIIIARNGHASLKSMGLLS
jgi:DNA repair protein RadC